MTTEQKIAALRMAHIDIRNVSLGVTVGSLILAALMVAL